MSAQPEVRHSTWPVKYRHCSRRSVRSFSARRAACPVADRPGKLCEGMLHHRSNAFQRFTILFARFTACPFPLFSFSFSELILSPLLLPIVSPLLHLCSEFTRPLGGSFVSFSREQGREKRRKGLLRSSEFYIAI